jgi:hypothetical protein
MVALAQQRLKAAGSLLSWECVIGDACFDTVLPLAKECVIGDV